MALATITNPGTVWICRQMALATITNPGTVWICRQIALATITNPGAVWICRQMALATITNPGTVWICLNMVSGCLSPFEPSVTAMQTRSVWLHISNLQLRLRRGPWAPPGLSLGGRSQNVFSKTEV
jgi:hypothetical protein